jgi:hypothetical protein
MRRTGSERPFEYNKMDVTYCKHIGDPVRCETASAPNTQGNGGRIDVMVLPKGSGVSCVLFDNEIYLQTTEDRPRKFRLTE